MRAGELLPVVLACGYFFCVLACNYVLRPVRDAMGIGRGTEGLTWLMTCTFLATLCVNPLFSLLVARYSRRKFIPITYHVFAATLGLFYLLMLRFPARSAWLQSAFFIWFSGMFNLFAVSVFWGFMADLFSNEQGKRLFPLIGVGGTLGAIFGSQLTSVLVKQLGTPAMLIVAGALLELSIGCVLLLARRAAHESRPAAPAVVRAERFEHTTVWAGLRLILERPYLRLLCLYMLLQTTCNTFMYYQQQGILSAHTTDQQEQAHILANINTAVNTLALLMQLFLSGRLIATIGIPATLLLLPSVGALGFYGLGVHSTLGMLVAMQVAARACEYATARPARETLYTVVSRAERYQSKSFIDTFVYRGGDSLSGWANQGLISLGLTLQEMALCSVPLAIGWAATAFSLGRRQEALAARAAPVPAPEQASGGGI
ncbi:MAG: MFS transporter [Planctomycetota bacterium]